MSLNFFLPYFVGDPIIDAFLTKEQWSPKQIVGYCKIKGIDMVSYERIYQHIREDKCKGGELYLKLRHRLKHRKRPIEDLFLLRIESP